MSATLSTGQTTLAKPKRIESLDSIRGLAALAVLLGHTVGSFAWPVAWIGLPIVNLFFDGRSAVTMFFVLSGFVLSRPYLVSTGVGTAPKRLTLHTFYLRRITRIYLPWLFVFGLSALAKSYWPRTTTTIPPPSEWLLGLWNGSLTLSSVLRQCTFSLHEPTWLLIPPDWSLGVELKGSALIPLFVFLARKQVWLLLGVGLLLLLLLPTGGYYVSFVAGLLCARYFDRLEVTLRSVSAKARIGFLVLGLVLYQARLAASGFEPLSLAAEKTVWCMGTVGCGLILLASLASIRIEKVLTRRPIVFLGRISFSVYLLQVLVLICLVPPMVQIMNAVGLREAVWLQPLTICGSVALTVGLSAITYRWVEVPSMDFGRWLTGRFSKQ